MLQELSTCFSAWQFTELYWVVVKKMNRSFLTSSRSQWLQLAKRWFLAVGDDVLLCFSKAERICKVKVDLILCIRHLNWSNGESFNLEGILKTMTCNKTLLVNAERKPKTKQKKQNKQTDKKHKTNKKKTTKKPQTFLNTEVVTLMHRISLIFQWNNNKKGEMQTFSH